MKRTLSLFTGFGVEMEYMIVDRQTLSVRALSAALLQAVEGQIVSETDQGALCWCNELVSHVVELKTNGPVSQLTGIAEIFQADVRRINALLEPMGAVLLPTAMHPWMDPFTETVLWEHEYSGIYNAFNAIFDCRGHGWANLQSTHLNLPFANDQEFGRLHAAVRAILAIIPVLSASSPVMDGRLTGTLDNRLAVYRTNAQKIPSVTGDVIPEPCFTEASYRANILHKIYDAIAPYDPDGVLQDEWLNSRGAIARFDRNTIEIRTLDIQEFPGADMAIITLITEVLRYLTNPQQTDFQALCALDTLELNTVLESVTRYGRLAEVHYAPLCHVLGVGCEAATGASIWKQLYRRHRDALTVDEQQMIQIILDHGNLAERITAALGANPERDELGRIYRQLQMCLHRGEAFLG